MLAPVLPRLHLFEIADQEWFPQYLRAYVQAALTQAWTVNIPGFQKTSPAELVARNILKRLGNSVRDYVFIDFCSGAGGPTPSIERHLNAAIAASHEHFSHRNGLQSNGTLGNSVKVVMTDLHPHIHDWDLAAKISPNLTFIEEPVDAANVPEDLVDRVRNSGSDDGQVRNKRVFRMFSLSFHHFDDVLAKRILKNTMETSDAFGIFELQERTLGGLFTCCVFGIGIMALAPYYAYIWNAPLALFFTYAIPILPFVLVVDGWVSALRTRTPSEIETLMKECDPVGGEKALADWELMSGKEEFFWPFGYLNWIICVRRSGARSNGPMNQQPTPE